MNAVDPQLSRSLASERARATRAEMYADWIAHDCDGLAAALTMPSVFPETAATLAEARGRVALALHHIDRAIEREKQAQAQESNHQ